MQIGLRGRVWQKEWYGRKNGVVGGETVTEKFVKKEDADGRRDKACSDAEERICVNRGVESEENQSRGEISRRAAKIRGVLYSANSDELQRIPGRKAEG